MDEPNDQLSTRQAIIGGLLIVLYVVGFVAALGVALEA